MNHKINQIILAHSNNLSSKSISEYLKGSGVKTYILDEQDYTDFTFLLEDLSPCVFMIDNELYKAFKGLFNRQLEAYGHMKKIILYTQEVDDSLISWDVKIKIPFKMDELAKTLNDLMNK